MNKILNRPKSLMITIIVIFLLGVITNSSKLFIADINIFVIGVFVLSLVPYLSFAFLAYLINSLWITLISGLFILGLTFISIWKYFYGVLTDRLV